MNYYIFILILILIFYIYIINKFRNIYFNKNKITILITGSTKGIGYKFASCLNPTKYQVIVTGRTNVNNIVQSLLDLGIETYGIYTDFSSICTINYAISYLLCYFGKIDILVNNMYDSNYYSLTNYDNLLNTYKTNLVNVSHFTNSIAQNITNKGKIINIGSIASCFNSENIISNFSTDFNYILIKNYIEKFTKLLSTKYKNICITCIRIDDIYFTPSNKNLEGKIKFNNLDELVPLFHFTLNTPYKELSGRIIHSKDFIKNNFYSNLELNINNNYIDYNIKNTFQIIKNESFNVQLGENFIGHSPLINQINFNQYNFSKYEKNSNKLKEVLSLKYNVPIQSIAINNGISNTSSFIIQTFVKDFHEVINTVPTWNYYNELVNKFNKVNILSNLIIKNNQLNINYEDILSKITPLTRLIILLSPIDKKSFTEFCRNIPKNIFILIDHCYDEFINYNHKMSQNDILKLDNNIISLFSFSKFHALASIGVGFSISKYQISSILEQSNIFNISEFIQDIILTALNDNQHNQFVKTQYSNEKKYIIQRLQNNNIHFIDSHQNFIYIKYNQNIFTQKLLSHNFKSYQNFYIKNYVPIIIDSHDINKKILDILLTK